MVLIHQTGPKTKRNFSTDATKKRSTWIYVPVSLSEEAPGARPLQLVFPQEKLSVVLSAHGTLAVR